MYSAYVYRRAYVYMQILFTLVFCFPVLREKCSLQNCYLCYKFCQPFCQRFQNCYRSCTNSCQVCNLEYTPSNLACTVAWSDAGVGRCSTGTTCQKVRRRCAQRNVGDSRVSRSTHRMRSAFVLCFLREYPRTNACRTDGL